MIKTVHPFPARMGPDLAIKRLRGLRRPSIVLDPMSGSGTVLRHAAELGHEAIGRDLDPLAILMASVWTTPVDGRAISRRCAKLLELAQVADPCQPLPSIDDDPETQAFVEYWFAKPQRNDLRRLAIALKALGDGRCRPHDRATLNVLQLGLSRIVITKDRGASLGRDVSHSRPHKVATRSSYQVLPAFEQSVTQLRDRLCSQPPPGRLAVEYGDARALHDLPNGSIDIVLSSPPYLNAIDYMRAHRLSLVWLGYRLRELRTIRATSVGSERGPDTSSGSAFEPILEALGSIDRLPSGDRGMVHRYAGDIYRLMSEMARVLKTDGRAFLVVGNSCIRKTFVRNSAGFAAAGRMVGLKLTGSTERELPPCNRYLPMPKRRRVHLGNRMRTETVLTFKHV